MKIHFTAIAGTGMGSVAGLMKEAGHEVKGSDEHIYPPMSDVLESLGIEVFTPFGKDNLNWDPDVVVVGNVCRKDHKEVLAAQSLGLRLTSFPALLEETVLKDGFPVVIAGTHGKTTTSTMSAYLLDRAGFEPGWLIGGVPHDLPRGFNLGSGKYFVLEGDEYDTAFFDKVPKFLHYAPKALLLTGVEFDHADIYENLDAVLEEFDKLTKILPENAPFLGAFENEYSAKTVKKFKNGETYGLEAKADWHVSDIEVSEEGTSFNLFFKTQNYGRFSFKLFGEYNLRNIIGALGLSLRLGADVEKLRKALPEFKGVKRRQELIGEVKGIKIYDDFGHHPTAVRVTLKGFSNQPHKRIIAVFEPRSATTRRRIFQKDYADAFEADAVFVAPPYDQSRIAEDNRFDPAELVKDLKNKGIIAEKFDDFDSMESFITSFVKEGDLVIFFSSGSFGNLPVKLFNNLSGT